MSYKILVVDDSSLSRRALRRILETEGHEVIEAEDGHAAIERYFLEKPDLVFLDLVMKEMYGLDALARLRELDPQARVIIATADIQSSTRAMAEQAGALGVVTKPFMAELTLDCLRRAMEEANHAAI